jgi:tetratricopeptide (TPR) repeat protein
LIPNDADTLDSRGFAYLKLKNPDAAINDYNAALAVSPKMASSLYGRGLAEQIKGDQAAASKDIAAAKAIQANIADQFAKLGIPATNP